MASRGATHRSASTRPSRTRPDKTKAAAEAREQMSRVDEDDIAATPRKRDHSQSRPRGAVRRGKSAPARRRREKETEPSLYSDPRVNRLMATPHIRRGRKAEDDWLDMGVQAIVVMGKHTGKEGKVSYIGPVHFARGNWIGLTLEKANGQTDGSIFGQRYFSCEPNKGLFVKAAVLFPAEAAKEQHLLDHNLTTEPIKTNAGKTSLSPSNNKHQQQQQDKGSAQPQATHYHTFDRAAAGLGSSNHLFRMLTGRQTEAEQPTPRRRSTLPFPEEKENGRPARAPKKQQNLAARMLQKLDTGSSSAKKAETKTKPVMLAAGHRTASTSSLVSVTSQPPPPVEDLEEEDLAALEADAEVSIPEHLLPSKARKAIARHDKVAAKVQSREERRRQREKQKEEEAAAAAQKQREKEKEEERKRKEKERAEKERKAEAKEAKKKQKAAAKAAAEAVQRQVLAEQEAKRVSLVLSAPPMDENDEVVRVPSSDDEEEEDPFADDIIAPALRQGQPGLQQQQEVKTDHAEEPEEPSDEDEDEPGSMTEAVPPALGAADADKWKKRLSLNRRSSVSKGVWDKHQAELFTAGVKKRSEQEEELLQAPRDVSGAASDSSNLSRDEDDYPNLEEEFERQENDLRAEKEKQTLVARQADQEDLSSYTDPNDESSQQNSTGKGWTCEGCTFVNDVLHLVCDMCGAFQPRSFKAAHDQAVAAALHSTDDAPPPPPPPDTDDEDVEDEEYDEDLNEMKMALALSASEHAMEQTRRSTMDKQAAEAIDAMLNSPQADSESPGPPGLLFPAAGAANVPSLNLDAVKKSGAKETDEVALAIAAAKRSKVVVSKASGEKDKDGHHSDTSSNSDGGDAAKSDSDSDSDSDSGPPGLDHGATPWGDESSISAERAPAPSLGPRVGGNTGPRRQTVLLQVPAYEDEQLSSSEEEVDPSVTQVVTDKVEELEDDDDDEEQDQDEDSSSDDDGPPGLSFSHSDLKKDMKKDVKRKKHPKADNAHLREQLIHELGLPPHKRQGGELPTTLQEVADMTSGSGADEASAHVSTVSSRSHMEDATSMEFDSSSSDAAAARNTHAVLPPAAVKRPAKPSSQSRLVSRRRSSVNMDAVPQVLGVRIPLVSSMLQQGMLKSCMVHMRITEAKNLMIADVNGLSDPYVRAQLRPRGGGKGLLEVKTSTIEKTLNPVWGEEFSIPVDLSKGGLEAFELVFRCYDKDMVGKDDFLGEVVVPLSEFNDTNEIAEWFLLKKTATDAKPHASRKATKGHLGLVLVLDADRSAIKQKQSQLFAVHRTSLLHRAAHFIDRLDIQHVEVFVGTWNVGNAPPPEDLKEYLGEEADVYVLGAQECEYKARSPHSSCDADWTHVLQSSLGPNYVLLGSHSLLQLRTHVFVSKNMRHLVSDVTFSREATGVAGVVGNKGGVAVSFHIRDTSVCFINAHLAAHQDMIEKRNADVQEILDGIKLQTAEFSQSSHVELLAGYDHVFFFGDLNYRLNYGSQGNDRSPSKELFDRMVQHIQHGDIARLFKHDQLQEELQNGRLLSGFEERAPSFQPTFKLMRNRLMEYNPERSPAWCDRVLWRSRNPEQHPIEQTSFDAFFNVMSSDHKPVRAIFDLSTVELQSGLSSTLGPCTLKISGLRALRLTSQNSFANPYVRFLAPFLKPSKSYKTSTKNKTLNPIWRDSDLPSMPLIINSKPRLARSNVIIQVWDSVRGSDVLMGSGVLSLHPVVAPALPSFKEDIDGKEAHSLRGEFLVELTLSGIAAGRVMGTVILEWAASSFQPIILPVPSS